MKQRSRYKWEDLTSSASYCALPLLKLSFFVYTFASWPFLCRRLRCFLKKCNVWILIDEKSFAILLNACLCPGLVSSNVSKNEWSTNIDRIILVWACLWYPKRKLIWIKTAQEKFVLWKIQFWLVPQIK